MTGVEHAPAVCYFHTSLRLSVVKRFIIAQLLPSLPSSATFSTGAASACDGKAINPHIPSIYFYFFIRRPRPRASAARSISSVHRLRFSSKRPDATINQRLTFCAQEGRRCQGGGRHHLQVTSFELHLRQLLHRRIAAVQARGRCHQFHKCTAHVARHFRAAAHIAAAQSESCPHPHGGRMSQARAESF
jgi:hypothetical protein